MNTGCGNAGDVIAFPFHLCVTFLRVKVGQGSTEYRPTGVEVPAESPDLQRLHARWDDEPERFCT